MSNFKPYWTRHPVQLRIFALLFLLTFPITLTPILIFAYWDEIYGAFKMNIRLTWKVITGEWKP